MGRIRIGTGLLLFVATLSAASTVRAQSQWTAVFFVEGRGARMGQANVERVARSHLMVIPASEVREATRRLEADVETPEGRAAVARDRNASLIVVGTMRGRDAGMRISIEVQDVEGQRISDAASRLPRTGPDRDRFARVIGAAFQTANQELDQRARAAREQELAADTREVVSVDEERPGDDDDGPAVERTKPFLVGLVGIGGRGRNASVDLTSGRTRNYSYPMYPELTLYVEGRPLAFLGAPLHGVYAVAQFGVALSVNTRDGMTGIQYGSSAWRLDVLAGYLHGIDTGSGEVEIGANVGFSYDTFAIDTNPIFPAVEYPAIRIGLAGRIPIFEMLKLGPDLEKLLRLDIDGGIRIVLGTGSLAPFFAESASAFGFDIMGSLTGMLDFGLSYAVRFGFIGYALSMGAALPAPADSGTGGFDGGVVLTIGLGWQI
jgi:hypothetical protein